MSHFLRLHPTHDVPLKIVLDWIDAAELRCPLCYISCDDVPLHYETQHVKSVRLQFKYDETVTRGEDGMLTCPMCPEKFHFSDALQVRLD